VADLTMLEIPDQEGKPVWINAAMIERVSHYSGTGKAVIAFGSGSSILTGLTLDQVVALLRKVVET
jgi:hypothetical protein